uniref:Uncharacterized protein n=1 Tax=viral metagenome TaxID=1070528 RepID=A0A6C0CHQ3_9ZZZZ
MKAGKYLPVLFIGLAIVVLAVYTNQQRERFGFGGGIDMCALQLSGINQRITNLEHRANDAQDNANTGVGQIQMVAKS